MSDFTLKNIEDIKVGDEVASINENPDSRNQHILTKSKVYTLYRRMTEGYYKITHPLLKEPICITGEHPVRSYTHGWIPVSELTKSDKLLVTSFDPYDFYDDINRRKGLNELYNRSVNTYIDGYDIEYVNEDCMVYNFETTSHTYIVGRLVVHNCYQFNKSPMRMSFDTAKMFIDKLLNDEYGYINRYNSPAIIIEFIGGEPLLEIKLTRQIYEYFLDKCYELNHPWFTMHRLSICSNGLQYFNSEVQEFFKLYSSQVSFNISIDGNKELHDSCRIQPNGEGSYSIDIAALNHYNKHYSQERNSKMTLAPGNISHLYESVIDFIAHDMKSININCVFEEGWTSETARIEYYQLKKLADYIIDNDLDHIYIAIFRERQEDKNDISMDSSSCGGSGSMLSIRPNGQFYPCIRYMPTSVGNDVRDLCLGSVQTGLVGRSEGSDILEEMDRNTRRSQTNDICFNCPIANSCAACSALGQTVFGNFAKKTTFHCIQNIAECLANVYYWNRLLLKHPEYDLDVRKNNVPDKWARIIINADELEELKLLECAAMIVNGEQQNSPEINNE
jgi:radical SAM peptide maturase (CXXX-repeat target family)